MKSNAFHSYYINFTTTRIIAMFLDFYLPYCSNVSGEHLGDIQMVKFLVTF